MCKFNMSANLQTAIYILFLSDIKDLYSRKDTNHALSHVARFYATTEQK